MVLTLVERDGSARSFHVDGARIADLAPIIYSNLSREAVLMTDEHASYKEIGRHFISHYSVNHGKEEYVPGHTNTIEGFYSIFKRGTKGVYQHCAEKHLHRYPTEFDFHYSNRLALGIHDGERAHLAVKAGAGKRLTYRQTN